MKDLTREELTRNLARLLKSIGMTCDATLGIITLLRTDEMIKKMTEQIVEKHPKNEDEVMEILFDVKEYRDLDNYKRSNAQELTFRRLHTLYTIGMRRVYQEHSISEPAVFLELVSALPSLAWKGKAAYLAEVIEIVKTTESEDDIISKSQKALENQLCIKESLNNKRKQGH